MDIWSAEERSKLWWFGHVKRPRGRPRKRWVDDVRVDMEERNFLGQVCKRTSVMIAVNGEGWRTSRPTVIWNRSSYV